MASDNKLLNLADALVDDLFETPDEEILREAREDGIDPEQLAEDMKARFEALAAKMEGGDGE